jgi:hypothetical protein
VTSITPLVRPLLLTVATNIKYVETLKVRVAAAGDAHTNHELCHTPLNGLKVRVAAAGDGAIANTTSCTEGIHRVCNR